MDLKEKVEILKKKNKIKQIKGLDALIELADLIRSERGDLKRLIEKVGGTLKNLESLDFNDLISTIKQIKISPQVSVNVEYLQGVEKLLKELKQQQQADDSFDAEELIRLLKKPENAIAVRLTKKDAAEFYNALMTVIGGGGGGGGIASIPLVKVLLVGQAKIAVTGTAVRLPANNLKNGVIIGALSTNNGNIAVGNSDVDNVFDGTGLGRILEPGAETSFAVDNTNRLYINGEANDLISFAGS